MADPTQADRDAAADLYRYLFPDNDIRAANIQLGNIDDGYAVQAFALHAQQAREQALEEADDNIAGPYSIGGLKWPGLSKVAEECGELLQVLGKLVGANGAIDHWDGTNLRDRLHEEAGDVLASLAYLTKHNDLSEEAIFARAQAKEKLFNKWHTEADEKRALKEQPPC